MHSIAWRILTVVYTTTASPPSTQCLCIGSLYFTGIFRTLVTYRQLPVKIQHSIRWRHFDLAGQSVYAYIAYGVSSLCRSLHWRNDFPLFLIRWIQTIFVNSGKYSKFTLLLLLICEDLIIKSYKIKAICCVIEIILFFNWMNKLIESNQNHLYRIILFQFKQ